MCNVETKAKLSLYLTDQPPQAENVLEGGGRGIAPPFRPQCWVKVSSQIHALAALPLGKKPLVPTGYKAGWCHEEEKNLLP
jgi:hypothetical protein